MEVYFIRHGQSANNFIESAPPGSAAAQSNRHQDPELTDRGQRQAECAARYLAQGGHLYPDELAAGGPFLDRLYCSPMIRALHTAQYLGQALGLRPQVWVEIHEMGGVYLDQDGGRVGFPGLRASQIRARFPEAQVPPQITEEGWWRGGFEQAHQGKGRAIGAARQLRNLAGEGGRVGLVSHGDFLNSLLKALENQLPGEATYWEHRNTGITRLDFEPGGRMVLKYLNRVEHLSAELLTRG
ncbi:MAG: histidine phosphatase family protein [Candidatus Handelsmanbacteria bacterium]|nr:histidine phosphatase family protein [Candidatus Handelsmanbacteria bacterium]